MAVSYFHTIFSISPMASDSVPSSPTAAIVMSPNGLGLGQTPTTSQSFIEELESMGFSGTTSSDDARKDLEWLESWNPAKVLPVHTGAWVIETGRKFNSFVDLSTTKWKH